jgi:hypothetical protein
LWPWRGYDRGVGSWFARVAGDGVITKASSNQDKALPMTAIRQGINQAVVMADKRQSTVLTAIA